MAIDIALSFTKRKIYSFIRSVQKCLRMTTQGLKRQRFEIEKCQQPASCHVDAQSYNEVYYGTKTNVKANVRACIVYTSQQTVTSGVTLATIVLAVSSNVIEAKLAQQRNCNKTSKGDKVSSRLRSPFFSEIISENGIK
ncbi:hypothetical protein OUZ56_001981 [Daphnia magna]|uniref:Uncharacterized protein n=1 Tax=Daphnia magna TaxID=35525 RepID=A0ABR0A4B5_9CRUS|nr:hypothetical protein OUZ56_001981 [Daphnia magna]